MSMLMSASAALLWAGLMWLEWRRVDRRHRVARLSAMTLAVAALAGMGLNMGGTPVARAEAVLWTAQAAGGVDVMSEKVLRFALPDAKGAPADAVVVPDLAYVRRTWPGITELEIRGDGVEAEDAPLLTGLRVQFQPTGTRLGFVAMDAPTQMALGEKLHVRGRVGIATGKSAVVTLEGPDGAFFVSTLVASASGAVDFDFVAPSAPSAGRFVWHLRLAEGDAPERVLAQENLGVAVVAPMLPRVLVLENAPRMDTARLRAWLAEKGGRVVSRTLISRDRYRFGGSGGDVSEFGALDERLLAGYDVVVADGAALAALREPERMVLRNAVSERGLGVGLLADDALLTAAQGSAGANADGFFLPWRVAAVGEGEAADNGRRVRLQGPPGSTLPAEPAVVAAFEIKAAADQVAWLRDGQTRTVASAIRRGLGWVAMTLVRDTWQWRQGERPAAFAEYWSWWLQALAPADTKGRWSLATTLPRVDQRVSLRWSGKGEAKSVSGAVKADGAAGESGLALAQDRIEPTHWTGDFWPHQAGWHRVTSPDGNVLDFWVNSADAWPYVRAQMKRDATARAVAESLAVAPPLENAQGRAMPPAWVWLTLLVVGAGYLWLEGRQRRRV